MVVSATKADEDALDVAAPVSVVSGDELRRRGAKTVADALQDVAGLDTGNGSDNGNRLANIGVWGLKEFDALLVTVDGVPAGGPFNPSLAQISVEDIDRIEIVKGPQGTLYGVSAFAGMIQVFTRHPKEGRRSAHARRRLLLGQARQPVVHGPERRPDDPALRHDGAKQGLAGRDGRLLGPALARLQPAHERGLRERDRLASSATRATSGRRFPSTPGSPCPGSRSTGTTRSAAHGSTTASTRSPPRCPQPLSATVRLENTLGLTRDEQIPCARSSTRANGTSATATRHVPHAARDDVLRRRADRRRTSRGRRPHDSSPGIAYTSGKTTLDGTGFDFSLLTGPHPVVPTLDEVPVGRPPLRRGPPDVLGLLRERRVDAVPRPHAHVRGALRPHLRVARRDGSRGRRARAGRRLGQPDGRRVVGRRRRRSSGIVDKPQASVLDALNVYVSAKSNFKPAAPNILEAESARILEPERARSGEIGLKTRWARGTLSFDVTFFHMNFENLVVSTVGPGRPAPPHERGRGAVPGHGRRARLGAAEASRAGRSRRATATTTPRT